MAAQVLTAAVTGFFLFDAIGSLVPRADSKLNTLVQVSLGTTNINGGSDLMGGNIPNIQLWNNAGELIGSAPGDPKKTSEHGGVIPISVKPNKGMNGQEAAYIAVSAGGNDAICITTVSVAYPNGAQPLIWTGDLGSHCPDSDWSPQNKDTAGPHHPSNCVWIDGDYSNGLKNQGLALHITDFKADKAIGAQFNDTNDLLCNAPARQKFYHELRRDDWPLFFQPPLEYNDDGSDKDHSKVIGQGVDLNPELLKRRSRRARNKRSGFARNQLRARNQGNDELSSFLHDTIIQSTSPSHSAQMICKSAGSISPDFVSFHEQLFCDMATRELWPLCSTTKVEQCFDTQTNTLEIHNASSGTVLTAVRPPQKSYASVANWG